ncbi:MAG: cell wall protein, partial [Marmoricola sp.]
MTRLRLATVSAVAVSAVLAAGSPMPQASAHPSWPKVELRPLGTYATGAFDEGGSEIVAYDARRHRAFSVNAQAGTVDVLDISDPTAPAKVATLATPGANSVAVQGRTIAVAEQAEDKTDPGTVALFDAATLQLVKRLGAGSLPDMVTISLDGSWAVVANEGEPEGYCEGQDDPKGSVSVIDLRRGASRASVRTASFTKYDGHETALRKAGIR